MLDYRIVKYRTYLKTILKEVLKMINVAINGFGRIGRMVFRAGWNDKKVNFVAINDLTSPENLAYLLKYDSVYGAFKESVSFTKDSLIVGKKKIAVYAEKEPNLLPWKKLKIDVVIESSGFFLTSELAGKHLEAGAKKVILTANHKTGDKMKSLIRGVNHHLYNRKTDHIISKCSCTTTCLSPIASVLDEKLGIQKGFLTTVHGVTNSQKIADSPHKTFREGRSILNNLIPTQTGAAVAVTRILPKLVGKLDGIAVRAPVPTGSLVDFTCTVKRKTSVEEVNTIFQEAAKGKMKGIIEYSEEELVSTDIAGNIHSAIFDSKLTRVEDNLVKIFAWYDNEYGYAHEVVEMIKIVA